MIVKYVRERGYQGEEKDLAVTLGQNYVVIAMGFSPLGPPHIAKYISILDESDGTPILLDLKFFDIIDPRVPPDWYFFDLGEGYYRLSPQEFGGEFWDLYHDGDTEAERVFEEVYRKIQRFHGIEVPLPQEEKKEELPFYWSDKWLREE